MPWRRRRHGSNESTSSLVRTRSHTTPQGAQQHSWRTLHGLKNILSPGATNEKESEVSLSRVATLDDYPEEAHTSTHVVRLPEKKVADNSAEKVLKSSSSKIVAANQELTPQTIMVASEHYFRLVLESYDHLKAAHYRASQDFSLAEWLHIHALLLYGKIQSVQKLSRSVKVDQHNRINLSSDIRVFDPIATALNAIGTVKDLEIGVLYIPEAHFPKACKDTIESALELQQILNGTLYDWQRSWMRVAEARQSRTHRDIEPAHAPTRSSSQLIMAIQQATKKVERAKQENRTMPVTSFGGDDSSAQEKDCNSSIDSIYFGDEPRSSCLPGEEQLHDLFEEARNAKDYTIRPPCDRLYSDGHPVLTPIYLEYKTNEQKTAAKRSFQPHQMPSAKGGLISNLTFDRKDSQFEFLASKHSKCAGGNVDEGGNRVPVLDRNQEPIQSIRTDSMASENKPEMASALYDLEASTRSSPQSSLRKTSKLRISGSKPYQSIPSPSGLLDTTSNETLVSSSTSSVRCRGAKVKIGESSYHNHSVQYDSQLWEDYARFVKALTEPDLANFSPLKSSEEGSYAWMIPVSVHENEDSRTLHLQLPRKSIPPEDQALALILQTSCASQDLLQSWHVSMTTRIPLKPLLTNYVKSAVKARF